MRICRVLTSVNISLEIGDLGKWTFFNGLREFPVSFDGFLDRSGGGLAVSERVDSQICREFSRPIGN